MPVTGSPLWAQIMWSATMNLNKILLRDFRNYNQLELDFAPGVNLIVGDNAQGKTNLLEAVAYLGSGKAFRTQKSAELVRLGAEFAEISGHVYSQERDQTLRWLLFPASRPRQLFQNGIKKKTAADISVLLVYMEHFNRTKNDE